MAIALFIKAQSFYQAKQAAHQRQIPIHDLAHNGGDIGEFRARTEETYLLNVQRWFNEPAVCEKDIGYPQGTLLFFRLTD